MRVIEIIEVEADRSRPGIRAEAPSRLSDAGDVRRTGVLTTMLKVFSAVVGLVVLVQALPAYYRHNEFDAFLKQQAGAPISSAQLTQQVLDGAGEYGLSLTEENINLQRSGGTFKVRVAYTVPLNLLVYRQDLKFESTASGWLPK
jgi:hypothetical protein